jgi:hypothetical protein
VRDSGFLSLIQKDNLVIAGRGFLIDGKTRSVTIAMLAFKGT